MSKTVTGLNISFPSLNAYSIGKIPKDKEFTFTKLSKDLELASNSENDEKQLKNLYTTVLPRLCFFSGIPLPVLESLYKLSKSLGNDIKKDHKKILRLIYYFLQVLIGPGQGGTPHKTEFDDTSSANNLPEPLLTEIWNSLILTPKDLAQHLVKIKIAGSIIRFNEKKIHKKSSALIELLKNVLSPEYKIPYRSEKRAFLKGLTSSKTNNNVTENKEKTQLNICACLIIRSCLNKKERKKLVKETLALLKTENNDSQCVCHVLNIAVEVAETNPQLYSEIFTPFLEKNIELFLKERIMVFMDGEVLMGKTSEDSNLLNISNVFSRKYLAQGCASVVLSLGKKGRNNVFWKVLEMLIRDDPSYLVVFEAIKSMAGARREMPLDIFSKTQQRVEFKIDEELEEKEKENRPMAWQNITKADINKKEKNKESKEKTIFEVIINRMRNAIATGNFSEVAGACRTSCELAKCRAYAISSLSGMKVKKSRLHTQYLEGIINDLVHIATSTNYFNAAIKHLALLALIWFQNIDGGPLSPAVFTQILRNGDSWTRQMLSCTLHVLFHRLVIEPKMATYILDCVNAVVAGHPSKVNAVELVDFWSQSFEIIDKTLVLNAALQFLESPSPPRVVTTLSVGNTAPALGSSTESFSAWRTLKRIVTWWLGEAANFISDEFVWETRTPLLNTSSNNSLAEVFCTETISNPLLMSCVSHLCHSMITEPWEMRLAAVKSLSSIAFRSGEPFRILIYNNFKQVLMNFKYSTDDNALGLIHLVEPVLLLLDEMYSGQIVIDECIATWGGTLEAWPEKAVESINKRHQNLLERVMKYCSVPVGMYFPLGPKSRLLLTGEEIPMAISGQDSVEFCRPQPQYSDFIDSNIEISNAYNIEEEIYNGEYNENVIMEDSMIINEVEENTTDDQNFDFYIKKDNSGISFNNSAFVTGNMESNYDEVVVTEPDPDFSFHVNSSPVNHETIQNINENGNHYMNTMENKNSTSNTASSPEMPIGLDILNNDNVPTEELDHNHQDIAIDIDINYEDDLNIKTYNNEEERETYNTTEHVVDYNVEFENPFNQDEAKSNISNNIPSPFPLHQVQVGFPKRATVLFDFDAEMEGELSVHIGDIIMVIAEEEDGWFYAKLDTVAGVKEGLVPCDYVEMDDN